MRSSQTSAEPASRGARRRRTVVVAALVAVAMQLAGCDEASVRQAAAPSASSSSVPTLPPIGFNHRFGTNPVAAADAFKLERTLFAQKEYWEVAMSTAPQEAGFVDLTDTPRVTAARARATSLVLTIATEYPVIISRLLSGGDDVQQRYCTGLVDQVRALGYTSLQKVTMYIFFTEQDEHAMLTWTPSTGYDFRVLDGDLRGTRLNPSTSATPFPSAPSH